MYKRKTASIQEIKNTVNLMIAAPKGTREGRLALGVFLSSLLLETGNYHGFNYLEWLHRCEHEKSGLARWIEDGKPDDTTPYLGDQSRVEYY